MAFKLADLVQETSTAPGVGTVSLNGAAAGRVAFVAAIGDGNTTYYVLADGTQAEWGVGTVHAGTPNTLTRDSVIGNTSGTTAKLNFTTTTKVYGGIPVERLPVIDSNGQFRNLPDGLVGTPGIAFEADLDTGFYRPTGNAIGIVAGGTEVARFDGSLATVHKGLVFDSAITPSTLTADQNDWNPTGLSAALLVRVSSDALRKITGIAGGVGGRRLRLRNVGANPVVLKDENAGSTAANRLALAADIVLQPDQTAELEYDGSSSRWTSDLPIAGFGVEASLASAATCDLGAAGSNLINITGTTAITSFGSSASPQNPIYRVRFLAALTLTHNATSLILPGSENIPTANGDSLVAQYLGSGNWRVIDYTKADGTAVVGPNTSQLARAWVNFNGTGTVAIRKSYNVSSITDNGVGDYTVNFTSALPDANYVVFGSAGFLDDSQGVQPNTATGFSTTSCRILTLTNTGSGSGGLPTDADPVSVGFFD